MLLLDAAHRVRDLNPAAENLLGQSRRRALGATLDTVTGGDRGIAELIERAERTGQTYARELDLAPTPQHPEERIVDCRVTPVFDTGVDAEADAAPGAAGEPLLLVELADVTRRVRITRENALIAQHGAGRKMVRQLAHEIKNPLGGLRGAAQLLARRLEDPALRQYTDVIIGEADRLAALVDTLLGPGGRPSKAEVNIHELLEHVASLVEAEAGERLRLERDYDPGLPAMQLDRDQIIQAILNLVRNAVAATEGRGRIVLRTRAVGNFAIGDKRHRVVASVEIEDDGPGIAPELRESVFFPLVTDKPGGTGLGLALAQELANRHGGLIEFTSRPGSTVFQLRLPLDDEDRRE